MGGGLTWQGSEGRTLSFYELGKPRGVSPTLMFPLPNDQVGCEGETGNTYVNVFYSPSFLIKLFAWGF